MDISKYKLDTVMRYSIALCIAVLICSFSFHFVESFFYDLKFRLNPFSHKNELIKIITVDLKTVEALKGQPTFYEYNQFLETIRDYNPAAFYFTIDLKNIPGTPEDKTAFAENFSKIKNSFVFLDDAPNKGEEESMLSVGADFRDLKYTAAALSYDYKHFAEDAVARRAVLNLGDLKFAQVQIAQLFNGISDLNEYRGVFELLGTKQINVNYQKPGTYEAISFSDLMSGKVNKAELENKIVLVGLNVFTDSKDYFKTVYSRETFSMPRVEAQANIIASLINNNGIIKSNRFINYLMTLLFVIIVTFSVFKMSPFRGIVLITGSVLAYAFMAQLIFSIFGYSLGMAQPIIATFTCYYFFIPYRLIQEDRKLWQLTQKNKLLTQVEELKNNFLSMMSHDLKTPLARIQGMADIALAKPQTLSEEQTNAITTIKKSSEELTEFITNILDLSRVESQQIKLNLQPKDINLVLDEVISKYEYLAQQKNIEILKEFEPLFSVKVDTELMRQIFSNLIENAIKYSPENTKILVTTEEMEGLVVVQVADQGIGITETEIKNIFTKFYRTKKVKNSQIKGSGLGLYLAKYFIELHKGRINVESIPQQGSTFTVEIPMNQ